MVNQQKQILGNLLSTNAVLFTVLQIATVSSGKK